MLTAVAMLAPPTAAATAVEPEALAAFEARFKEGQAKFDRGEYLAAARTWLEAAKHLRETAVNINNRIAVHEYAIDAFTRGLVNVESIEALREAVTALEDYCEGFTRAHGTETPISPKIVAGLEDFRARLARAEEQAKHPQVLDVSKPGEPARTGAAQVRGSKGLMSGGGVLLGLGGSGLALAVAGAVRGASLERKVDDPANMCDLAAPGRACAMWLDSGKAANSMALVGAVIAPILVGAGIGLLVVGLKRRRAPQHLVAPAVVPGWVGLALHGAF